MTGTAPETSFGSYRLFKARAELLASHQPHFDPTDEAFEARRGAILCAGNRSPLERVAALLIAISRNNSHEGRDPAAIPETLTCGFVADLLGFPIATLASLLKLLEERGLVTPDEHSGLRLTNLPRLEKLGRA